MYPTRIPSVLDLGKPKPLGAWVFPFAAANDIECGSD
jgi:hypothetical protein